MPIFSPNPLTPDWKSTFAAHWVHNGSTPQDHLPLEGDDRGNALESPNSEALGKYRIGPYLLLPVRSEDCDVGSCVEVLAVAGFTLEKEIEIALGNDACGTLVFVELADYQGPRGALLRSRHDGLTWLTILQ